MMRRFPRAKCFQPTLPVRGATPRFCVELLAHGISIHAPRAGSDFHDADYIKVTINFNPRSPCGERQRTAEELTHVNDFNPRSPCGERPKCVCLMQCRKYFNPRSPCGERQVDADALAEAQKISIHAPRAGSDYAKAKKIQRLINFNPRSPCGERPSKRTRKKQRCKFQSTLPVRGATEEVAELERAAADFNPRSPCGERQKLYQQ